MGFNWHDIEIIDFPKIADERGNLSFFESKKELPFSIARTYWIYDVPGGEIRGGHAYKKLQEVVVALSGSFDIVLNDGQSTKRITLNRSYMGLYIPKMIWRHLENFSTNSLALIVSDKHYNGEEYIRDFEEYKQLVSWI